MKCSIKSIIRNKKLHLRYCSKWHPNLQFKESWCVELLYITIQTSKCSKATLVYYENLGHVTMVVMKMRRILPYNRFLLRELYFTNCTSQAFWSYKFHKKLKHKRPRPCLAQYLWNEISQIYFHEQPLNLWK